MFRAEQRAEAEYAVRARAFAIAVARSAGRTGLGGRICIGGNDQKTMDSEQKEDIPMLEAAWTSDGILTLVEYDEARGGISRV